MTKALATNTDELRRQRFEGAVQSQHDLAVRTVEALKKITLLTSATSQKTELTDYAKGQVDPQIQLLLIARDQFLEAEDPISKLGFYKSMRDVMLAADEKAMKVLDMAMRERHHREKLALMEQKMVTNEPSDAEVDAAMGKSDV